MKIFLIILHYKDKDLTFKCLTSIKGLTTKPEGVIVIDNHSSEPIDRFKKFFPEMMFIKNNDNLGYAEGNNVGIRLALKNKAEAVMLLNPDTVVDKDFIDNLVNTFDTSNSAGIVGPKIYFAKGWEYHKNRYQEKDKGRVIWYAGGEIDWQNVYASHRGVDEIDRGQFDREEKTGFVSGCAMLVKREVFEKAGLLDSRYFLYLEDLEFCLRAKKAGFGIFYNPKAKIWHMNAGSSEVGGSLHDYYFTRNRMLFGLKYAPLRAKAALLRESVRLFLSGRKWQKIGIRDFFLGKFGKGSWLE